MDYERFIKCVERAGSMRESEAVRATSVTLAVLGERLDPTDALELSSALPAALAAWLLTEAGGEEFGGEEFDVDEFLRRVAERENVGVESARRDARAVFAALAEATGVEKLVRIVAALPPEYEQFLPPGDPASRARTNSFMRRVHRRAPLRDIDATWRATEAVLETLAERIDGHEVEDLLARLPVELHAPLWRGVRSSSGKAEQMTLDEFVARVADRTGSTREDALVDARAVFVTLRQFVGDQEFFDIVTELPREYVEALDA
jgi:uncharacterized protein (DUF2267 family)